MGAVLRWVRVAAIAIAGLIVAAIPVVHLVSDRVLQQVYERQLSTTAAVTTPEALTLGAHLAQISGCADCHGAALEGRALPVPGSTIYAPNLRLLAQTYTDGDFDRAIRQGLKADGTSLVMMPSAQYSNFSEEEIGALIGYLRSLKAEGQPTPASHFGLPMRAVIATGQFLPARAVFEGYRPAVSVGATTERGRHLALIACAECHTATLEGSPGPVLISPDLAVVASYERKDFIKLLRTGKARGDRTLAAMTPAASARFVHLTDEEVNAIYDYLVARSERMPSKAE